MEKIRKEHEIIKKKAPLGVDNRTFKEVVEQENLLKKKVKNKEKSYSAKEKADYLKTNIKNIKEDIKKPREKVVKEPLVNKIKQDFKKSTRNGLENRTKAIRKVFNNRKNFIKNETRAVKNSINKTSNTIRHPVKALKNAGSNLGQTIKNKAIKAGLDTVEAIDKKIKDSKVIAFILVQWKKLLLGFISLQVLLIVLAFIQPIGKTPHYYCSIDYPSEIKKTDDYKLYCGIGGKNDSIAAAALSLADEYYVFDNSKSKNNSEVIYRSGLHTGKQLYIDTFSEYSEVYTMSLSSPNTPEANCIAFVNTCLNWVGCKDVPKRNPGECITDLQNSENWQEVAFSQDNPDDTLEAGDVLLSEYYSGGTSHTFIWVGSEAVQEVYPELDESYKIVEAGWEHYGAIVTNYTSEWFNTGKEWHAFRYIGELDPK